MVKTLIHKQVINSGISTIQVVTQNILSQHMKGGAHPSSFTVDIPVLLKFQITALWTETMASIGHVKPDPAIDISGSNLKFSRETSYLPLPGFKP